MLETTQGITTLPELISKVKQLLNQYSPIESVTETGKVTRSKYKNQLADLDTQLATSNVDPETYITKLYQIMMMTIENLPRGFALFGIGPKNSLAVALEPLLRSPIFHSQEETQREVEYKKELSSFISKIKEILTKCKKDTHAQKLLVELNKPTFTWDIIKKSLEDSSSSPNALLPDTKKLLGPEVEKFKGIAKKILAGINDEAVNRQTAAVTLRRNKLTQRPLQSRNRRRTLAESTFQLSILSQTQGINGNESTVLERSIFNTTTVEKFVTDLAGHIGVLAVDFVSYFYVYHQRFKEKGIRDERTKELARACVYLLLRQSLQAVEQRILSKADLALPDWTARYAAHPLLAIISLPGPMFKKQEEMLEMVKLIQSFLDQLKLSEFFVVEERLANDVFMATLQKKAEEEFKTNNDIMRQPANEYAHAAKTALDTINKNPDKILDQLPQLLKSFGDLKRHYNALQEEVVAQHRTLTPLEIELEEEERVIKHYMDAFSKPEGLPPEVSALNNNQRQIWALIQCLLLEPTPADPKQKIAMENLIIDLHLGLLWYMVPRKLQKSLSAYQPKLDSFVWLYAKACNEKVDAHDENLSSQAVVDKIINLAIYSYDHLKNQLPATCEYHFMDLNENHLLYKIATALGDKVVSAHAFPTH